MVEVGEMSEDNTPTREETPLEGALRRKEILIRNGTQGNKAYGDILILADAFATAQARIKELEDKNFTKVMVEHDIYLADLRTELKDHMAFIKFLQAKIQILEVQIEEWEKRATTVNAVLNFERVKKYEAKIQSLEVKHLEDLDKWNYWMDKYTDASNKLVLAKEALESALESLRIEFNVDVTEPIEKALDAIQAETKDK